MITTTTIKLAIINTNRKTSFCIGVISCLRLLVKEAILPNTVRSPIWIQTARAVPAIQCVP